MQPKRKRRRHELPAAEISVVSLMDVLTTLLFFLLMMSGKDNFFVVPAASNPPGKTVEDTKPKFALQVILKDSRTAYVWLGPYGGLRVHEEGTFTAWVSQHFKGNPEDGFYRKIEATGAEELRSSIQDTLITIKQSFPEEKNAVAAFSDKVPYQEVVDIVNAVRELPNARALAVKRPVGGKTVSTVLFPQVVVSEWNEGGAS
ncbi:MAG: biopolymer transporter ExbD [Bacteriovoracia bacterium]